LALLLPIVFAPIIYISRNKRYWGLMGCLVTYGLLSLVVLSTPMLSGFVHFAIIGMALLIIAVIKNWFGVNRAIGILLTLAPCIILFAVMLISYAQGSWHFERVVAVINPSSDPLGRGFLAIQVRALLGQAAFVGAGASSELFLHSWLYSDLILLTIITRFGWLAFVAIMGALLLFIGKVAARCAKQKSGLGFFVSIAVALTLFVQIFMYVLFNLGFPLTHISLPLISPGNSAMLINMVLIGLLLSVFRTGDAVVDNKVESAKQSNIFSWNDGKLTINFKTRA